MLYAHSSCVVYLTKIFTINSRNILLRKETIKHTQKPNLKINFKSSMKRMKGN